MQWFYGEWAERGSSAKCSESKQCYLYVGVFKYVPIMKKLSWMLFLDLGFHI